jgi:hypothetical protein
MKKLLFLLILFASCNDYEVLPDGRKYTTKDTCLRHTIVTYNYTTYMVIGNQSYPQVNIGTKLICLENRVDTIFINE